MLVGSEVETSALCGEQRALWASFGCQRKETYCLVWYARHHCSSGFVPTAQRDPSVLTVRTVSVVPSLTLLGSSFLGLTGAEVTRQQSENHLAFLSQLFWVPLISMTVVHMITPCPLVPLVRIRIPIAPFLTTAGHLERLLLRAVVVKVHLQHAHSDTCIRMSHASSYPLDMLTHLTPS